MYIYNGILFSYENEYIWVSSNEENEPRTYYTEWNKSEIEKQTYINTYIWNLERWYRWTYFQGSNRDIDIENRLVDKRSGGGEGGMKGESNMETYTLPCVK